MPKKGETVWQSETFLNLQKEWYAKLQEDGFEDIEQMDWVNGNPREMLKGRNGNFSSAYEARRAYSPDKQRYWELAGQFYWYILEREEYDDRDKELWKHWLDIGTYAGSARAYGCCTETGTKVIKRLSAEMLTFRWREDEDD